MPYKMNGIYKYTGGCISRRDELCRLTDMVAGEVFLVSLSTGATHVTDSLGLDCFYDLQVEEKPKKKKLTQADMILDWMTEGRKITALDALREFGCFRLAARISDLKNEGHYIHSEPYSYKTKRGETKTISRYFMDLAEPRRD